MKRWLTFVSVLALAVALGGALSRVPKALSEVDAFRVTEVRLRGQRFLDQAQLLEAMNLRERASVWDDTKILEERVSSHPLVEDARIYRRFPNALLVRVQEVQPVALFPNPTLEPVDASGRLLPIDPAAHGLDLPIMTGTGAGTLSPAGLRILAGEIQRLIRGDPELAARISDFALNPRGEVRARVTDPPVNLLFRPGLPSGRIQTGLRVLAHARDRFGEEEVTDLDLRFENQFVVRLDGARGN